MDSVDATLEDPACTVVRKDDGMSTLEYALLVAVLATGTAAGYAILSQDVRQGIDRVSSGVSSTTVTGPGDVDYGMLTAPEPVPIPEPEPEPEPEPSSEPDSTPDPAGGGTQQSSGPAGGGTNQSFGIWW